MSLTAPRPNAFREDDPDALYFLPLGGSGEIGMNLNLYGYRGQWLIVDCGVTFGEEEHQPGVDVIMADPAFIVERRDRLLGIVATHGHEDHIGAIPYLWPQLQCPIWQRRSRPRCCAPSLLKRSWPTRSKSPPCRCRAGLRSGRSTSN